MKVTVAELRRAIAGLKDDAALEIHLGPEVKREQPPFGYCARCASSDVIYQGRAVVMVMTTISYHRFRCGTCGRRWRRRLKS